MTCTRPGCSPRRFSTSATIASLRMWLLAMCSIVIPACAASDAPLAHAVAQCRGKLRVIEDANPDRVEKLRHSRGVAHRGKRPGHHHPVVTGQHAGNPIVIALRERPRHLALDSFGTGERCYPLFGSGSAGLGLAGGARATVIAWDEAINGLLSSDGLAPTPLTFIAGTGKEVLGTYGRAVANGPVDRDYFTFTVGPSSALTEIIVLPGTTAAGPLSVSFIGIEAGPQLTLPPTATTAAGLLGWRHLDPAADIGHDILPPIGNPSPPLGATGF